MVLMSLSECSIFHLVNGSYVTLELWTNLNYQAYSGMDLLNNRRLVFSLLIIFPLKNCFISTYFLDC